MLLVNGLNFAKNTREVLDSLFSGPVTAHGLYVIKHGRGGRDRSRFSAAAAPP